MLKRDEHNRQADRNTIWGGSRIESTPRQKRITNQRLQQRTGICEAVKEGMAGSLRKVTLGENRGFVQILPTGDG